MNVFAKFDEIPSMILEVIKKKQNVTDTRSVRRTDGRTDGRSDNVKTVYPPTNTVCRGYKNTTYVEANVLSMYAKLRLQPPYGF